LFSEVLLLAIFLKCIPALVLIRSLVLCVVECGRYRSRFCNAPTARLTNIGQAW